MQPLLLPRCRIVGGAASAIVSGSIKGKKAPNWSHSIAELSASGLCDIDENHMHGHYQKQLWYHTAF